MSSGEFSESNEPSSHQGYDYGSAWSDWEWNESRQFFQRYRLDQKGEWDWETRLPSSQNEEGSSWSSGDALATHVEALSIAPLSNQEPQYVAGTYLQEGRISARGNHISTRKPNRTNEKVDPKFRVHKSQDFTFGQVIWSEATGNCGTDITPSITRTKGTYLRIRRFLIVNTHQGHSTCLAIKTYGSLGILRAGVNHDDHAIVYCSKSFPQDLPDEAYRLKNHPIKLKMNNPAQKLDPRSLLDYGKVYSVEHNVKVLFIGEVHEQCESNVVNTFNYIHPPLPLRHTKESCAPRSEQSGANQTQHFNPEEDEASSEHASAMSPSYSMIGAVGAAGATGFAVGAGAAAVYFAGQINPYG